MKDCLRRLPGCRITFSFRVKSFKNSREKDIDLNWDAVLDFDGESGPYVQYTYARGRSVLRRADIDYSDADFTNTVSDEEYALIKQINAFGDAVKDAADKNEPFYINRYVTNNTLSDGVGENVETMGSEAMHTLVYQGVWIDVDNSISSLNGYIYPVNDILLYNSQVPNGVLNERMRFDTLSMLGEVMSSGFRGIYCQDMVSRSGNSSVGRIRFPVDYFDNIVVYNGNKTKLDMNLLANPGNNSFLLYKGDSFQGKGVYDFAIKLPPVPDGMYELRVAATNFGQRGSMMQFYLGESPDLNDLKPIDIPIDLRLPTSTLSGSEEDKARLLSIGYCEINNEDAYPDAYADRGVESDKVMRTHSYMRDGLSIVKESDGSNYKPVTYNARFAGYQLRRILTKENLKQRDYWLRVKSVLPKYDDKKFQLDYIEIVPQRVYDGVGAYREDLY